MMARIAPILLLAVASGVSAQSVLSAHSAQKPKADLIFTHGNIYTGVFDASSSFGAGKRSEALAVAGDHEAERSSDEDRGSVWSLCHARLQ
jgi:hypothetical protein